MINGMMYIRTAVPEIDGWERLGAKGWNWDTLWPFYKEIERFVDPTPEQAEAGAGVIPEYQGRSGDVAVGYPSQLLTGKLWTTLVATWETLGVSVCEDANGGKVEGFTVRPMMVDRESGLRASAATAFYYPISDRPTSVLYKVMHSTYFGLSIIAKRNKLSTVSDIWTAMGMFKASCSNHVGRSFWQPGH
jgi:choline dehydrogenase